jgi:hypothetical protein
MYTTFEEYKSLKNSEKHGRNEITTLVIPSKERKILKISHD